MNTTEQIMLLILAGALAVFLIIAIVAVVAIIRLVKTVQKIADKAERAVDSAEAVSTMVSNAVGKLNVLSFVHGIVSMVQGKDDKKGDR